MSEGKGEAPRADKQRTEAPVAERQPEGPATSTQQQMEVICQRENLIKAYNRVRQNKGAPGVDGMTVDQLAGHLCEQWPTIREQLLCGTYQPQPVKRVEIPKPTGGVRKLGIPTVLDRFIQQAVLQVLQAQWDPTFSQHSYGFRPGRSAHQAVAQAQQYIADGYGWVVDIDLEKFFDRVNHDMLMGRVAKRVRDKRVLKLIRAMLNAGVMENGLVGATREGTPQGGPLSPLLSNLFLDDLDRELEKRGHRFVRYADDCNIYVRSVRSARRVMEGITVFLTRRLKLKVNAAKSAVGRPGGRKFLGFRLMRGKLALAQSTIRRFKDRVRELTRRGGRRSLPQRAVALRRYLLGWRGYFGICQTPSVLRNLDSWIRRRLRAVAWKQWKTFRCRFKELRQRGVRYALARKTAASSYGPWRLSRRQALNIALPTAYFTETLRLPLLSPGR